MPSPRQLLLQTSPDPFDPAVDSVRYGFRVISGELPSSGERITFKAWAIVFESDLLAETRYREIVDMLGQVTAEGLAAVHLADVHADRFGNMSERIDQLGELTTLWVTSMKSGDGAYGAVLVALNGVLMHLLAVDPYSAEGEERAPRILERIAMSIAARDANLKLAPEDNTLARLPFLQDLSDFLDNAIIEEDRYQAPK